VREEVLADERDIAEQRDLLFDLGLGGFGQSADGHRLAVFEAEDRLDRLLPDDRVRLEPIDKHLHLLSVQLNEADASNPQKLEIKLNTIQLFDLMESLDRLCCDPLTLPEVRLVTQISDYRSQSALTNQALPAISGVISLAIATTVLYLIPTPKPQPKPVQTLPTQINPLPKVSTPPTITPSPSDSLETTPSPSSSPN
jgi:hypothetical protein